MSKRLFFLISFVLVLGLIGVAQAGTPIVVDNNSFEYDCNGVEVTCHEGHWITPGSMCDGYIAAWRYLSSSNGWVGVDVNCGWEDVNCDNCHDWIEYPDGTANLYFEGFASAHQILDHNIAYGRKYTMTVDLMAWDPIVLEFFSPNDVCYPDANHFLLSSTEITPTVWQDMCSVPVGRWMYERDVEAICVITDAAMDGRKLGIKIGGDYLIGGTDTSYLWADHVRLEWSWASNAYDPNPPDGTEDVNSQALTLSWLPGLWAVNDVNGHEVYFGTSWDEVNDATTATAVIYRGSGVGVVSGPDANNRYSYVVPGGDLPLSLGETYFWRIDEVNEDYVGSAPQPWKGEVWGFEVEGKAYNVYPADGATGIQALDLTIRWEAGAGAGGHDVYFGGDEAAVADANTNTAGIYRGPTQALADVNYLVPEDLEVGGTYYWRIDEVNNITLTFVKGDVWMFTTGTFLIVDSFEWYPSDAAIKDAWKDMWTGTIPKNHAEVFVEFADADKFLDTGDQSMKFYYMNFEMQGPNPVGCTAEATLPLEVGTNWTKGGVKALTVNFCGDIDNGKEPDAKYDMANDRPWLSLLDGDSKEGIVRYPTLSHLTDGSWHTWNISLEDPNFSDVNMADVAKVYIGFGGVKGGGVSKYGAGYTSGGDTVWFDDISLYPPRCLPEMTGLDTLRGLGDIGGGAEGAQDCNTNYLDLDIMAGDWMMTDGNVVAGAQNARITMAAGEPNWTDGHIDGGLVFDPNIKVDVNNPRLAGSVALSITAWVKRDGEMDGYEGYVTSREEFCTEMTNGVDGASVGYCWNNMNKTWMEDSGLVVPDANWTFIAISVDSTGCKMYAQVAGEAMQDYRHDIELGPLADSFDEQFWIGRGYAESRYWKGTMDDVRIYNWNLDDANMAKLADITGEPSPCPVYHYKFDETSGLVVADYGCGTEFYSPVQSAANLTDPEPKYQRILNFRDYRILAEHWLESHPWP